MPRAGCLLEDVTLGLTLFRTANAVVQPGAYGGGHIAEAARYTGLWDQARSELARATARTATLYVCRRRPPAVNSGHCGRAAGLAVGTISSSTPAPSSPMWPALARPRGRRRS